MDWVKALEMGSLFQSAKDLGSRWLCNLCRVASKVTLAIPIQTKPEGWKMEGQIQEAPT